MNQEKRKSGKNNITCLSPDGSPLGTLDIRVAADDKQRIMLGLRNDADDAAIQIKLVCTHPIRDVRLPDVIPPHQTLPVSFDVHGADIWGMDAKQRARQFGITIHCIWERRTGKA